MKTKSDPGALAGALGAGITSEEPLTDTKDNATAQVASKRKMSRREKLHQLYAEELERNRQYQEKWGGGGDLFAPEASRRGPT